jgi:hypothetical protein
MTIENYKWIPGQGPSLEALERMRAHFPKPSEPMGEAWFISETRFLWTDLLDKPLSEFPADQWEGVLWAISGTGNFGHLEEWEQWFRFLLPELIQRSNESWHLFENVINAFFNIFDQGITEEYKGFREDVFNTLPMCLMKPEYWFDWVDERSKQPVKRAKFLIADVSNPRFAYDWNFRVANEEVSAAMFFCLRYMTPEEMPPWVESLTMIQDPYWRGHLLVWLIGFMELVAKPPITPRQFEKTVPQLRWHDSFLARAWENATEFVSAQNISAFLSEVCAKISPEVLLRWVDDFAAQPMLADHLFDIPDLYFDKFFSQQI